MQAFIFGVATTAIMLSACVLGCCLFTIMTGRFPWERE